MKNFISIIVGLLILFNTFSVSANAPFNIFVEGKDLQNTDGYIVKDNKLYISEDALKRDFGFSVFYDKTENKYLLHDQKKLAYQARFGMFDKYADIYDPKSPDEVANLWAQGVKGRNGLFQYLALSRPLREEFKRIMKVSERDSWVTGFSSPWIVDYKIEKENIGESTFRYKILFKAITSLPETFIWHATITVASENGKWRIIKIDKDFDII